MSVVDFPSAPVEFSYIMVTELQNALSGDPSFLVSAHRDNGIRVRKFGIWDELERACREAYGFAIHYHCPEVRIFVLRALRGEVA